MTTYYVSTSGSDSNNGTSSPWRTIQKAANTISAGDTVYVRSGTYYEKVTISRSGSASSPLTFSAASGETVTIDGNGISVGNWNGLVEITGAYIIFQNFNVINSSFAGIDVHSANTVTVQGCYITNTWASGILVRGDGPGVNESTHIKILNNELYNTHTTNIANPESFSIQYGVNDIEAAYNYVHHVGVGSGDGREGLNIKFGVQYAYIHHNHIVDVPSVGIYPDAFSSYVTHIYVYDNLIEGGSSAGLGLSAESGGTADDVKFYNNIVTGTKICGIVIPTYDSVGGTVKNVQVINNTVYNNNNSDGGMWVGAWALTYVQNLTVRNNIFSNNTPTNYKESNPGRHSNIVVDHNLFYGDGTVGTYVITGNPLFVNISAGNVHLQPNSPAIGTGSSSLAPSTDYDGITRMSPPCIGAYEYSTSGTCPSNLTCSLLIA